MSVYHQMGHDSINLVKDEDLNQFRGAILSPVNYSQSQIINQIESMNSRENFEIIFDPQLYFPRTERGYLQEWSYFPEDVDTAIIDEEPWWESVVDKVVSTCNTIKCHSACSPAFAPKNYTSDYYLMMINIGNYFNNKLMETTIEPIQTVLVGLKELTTDKAALRISSIISKTTANRVYLIFLSDVPPRREISETDELKSAMKLINLLEDSGISVLVGFSSTDFVLWKAAGATSCATGKFFNLRRFTSSRFEEPSGGGGQLPYWFEENLLGFLRESDLIRVFNNDLVNNIYTSNPYSLKILESLEKNPEKAWLGLSWRQYMYGFADLERRIAQEDVKIPELLLNAEKKWLEADEKDILMEEARNNGEWIRTWRRALLEFKK